MTSSLRNKHITRFGSVLAPSGALYGVSDREGLMQMEIDLQLAQLQVRGIAIDGAVKFQVNESVRQRAREHRDKVGQVGIPDKIRNLIQATKKGEAEKYSRELVLSEYELFLFIHNCTQISFTHRSKFKQYIPEHLTVTETDRADMKTGTPKTFLKKISSSLLERRFIHVHLFEYSSNWHCFYFSHDDINPEDTNHWKYGCHLHYVSHLWPNFKKGQIWKAFNKRSTEISGNLHIRFEPFEFPTPDETVDDRLNKESERPPWADIFDPGLVSGSGSSPLPVAHVATRGIWFSKISIPGLTIP